MAAEKLGLLGQPSGELQRLKEELEGGKMRLEHERAAWDLERLRRHRQEEHRRIAEQEEQAQKRQQAEQERIRLETARAVEAQQRRKWFEQQAGLAAQELRRVVFREDLDVGDDPEALARALQNSLAEALRDSGPDSPCWDLDRARECAVSKTLEPSRQRKRHLQVVDSALSSIAPHLRELKEKGWISVPHEDVHLLAQQLEDPMRSILGREVQLRNLAEQQAREVLYDAIDRRLRII